MNPNEVVVHDVKRYGCNMVLDLLAESIRKSCKSPHRQPHCEVLPLHVTRADMVWIGVAVDYMAFAANAISRAITLLPLWIVAVKLHQLRVVNVAAERLLDGYKIGAQTIACKLNAILQTPREVVHEEAGGNAAPRSKDPPAVALPLHADCYPPPTTPITSIPFPQR